ncbi:TetR family transcriptional regulator [Neisseria meningitidis]|nr:TetR family transcriptional regulator [Neisseria meningitidis]
MAGIYDVMWEYRFLFSDVNTLLARSAELLGEHNTFTQAKVPRCWSTCWPSSTV